MQFTTKSDKTYLAGRDIDILGGTGVLEGLEGLGRAWELMGWTRFSTNVSGGREPSRLKRQRGKKRGNRGGREP